MTPTIKAKIQALHYVGSDEVQYQALRSVLKKGLSIDTLIDEVLEHLPTETYEALIQCEHC